MLPQFEFCIRFIMELFVENLSQKNVVNANGSTTIFVFKLFTYFSVGVETALRYFSF